MCTPLWLRRPLTRPHEPRGNFVDFPQSRQNQKGRIDFEGSIFDFCRRPSFWANRHVIAEHRWADSLRILPLRASHLRQPARRAKPRKQTRQAGSRRQQSSTSPLPKGFFSTFWAGVSHCSKKSKKPRGKGDVRVDLRRPSSRWPTVFVSFDKKWSFVKTGIFHFSPTVAGLRIPET